MTNNNFELDFLNTCSEVALEVFNPAGSGIVLTAKGQIPETLSMGEVCFMFRKPRGTINRWINAGNFPAPYKWPGGQDYWYKKDLMEWLANRPKRTLTPLKN